MLEYDCDVDKCTIKVSKHFRNKYMRKLNWDMLDLREAIKSVYKVDRVGKKKYEVYTKQGSSKKLFLVITKKIIQYS